MLHERKFVVKPGSYMVFPHLGEQMHTNPGLAALLKRAVPSFAKTADRYVVVGAGNCTVDTRVIVPIAHIALGNKVKVFKTTYEKHLNADVQASIDVSKSVALASMLASHAELSVQQIHEAKKQDSKAAAELKTILGKQMDEVKKMFDDVKQVSKWLPTEAEDNSYENTSLSFSLSAGSLNRDSTLTNTKDGERLFFGEYRVTVQIVDLIQAIENVHPQEVLRDFCLQNVTDAITRVVRGLTLDECLQEAGEKLESKINKVLREEFDEGLGIRTVVSLRDMYKAPLEKDTTSNKRRYIRRSAVKTIAEVKVAKIDAKALQTEQEIVALEEAMVKQYHQSQLAAHQEQLNREKEDKDREYARSRATEDAKREEKDLIDKLAHEKRMADLKWESENAAKKIKAERDSADIKRDTEAKVAKLELEHQVALKKQEQELELKKAAFEFEQKNMALPKEFIAFRAALGKTPSAEDYLRLIQTLALTQCKNITLTSEALLGSAAESR